MRVLLIYTYNRGLLSQFFKEISEKFVRDGCEVHTFYLKNRAEHFKINEVQYWGEKRTTLIKSYQQTFNVIKKVRPDIVISNFGYINPALICGKFLGVKRNIAWFHTAFGHSRRHWFHVWFKKQCFKLADRVITNSNSLSEDMTTYYGVPSSKLVEIPFWTNIEDLKEAPIPEFDSKQTGIFKIGCPGRLVKDKNHKLVIDALTNLSAKHTNWKLYIAGGGHDEHYLRSYVENKRLNNHIVFLGVLSSQEMKTFYEGMDLIVLPSLHEAFGLVFIEAIALGKPVFVSNSFGALEFLDKNDLEVLNFQFNPKDVNELEHKIDVFFTKGEINKSYFKDLYLANFSKDKVFNRLKEVVFDEVLLKNENELKE